MKINNNAVGIILVGNGWEFIRAIRKPQSKCKITQEIWFKGKVKHLRKLKNEKRS